MIDQLNARLKAANLGVRVYQRGDRLSLRAMLPPRPGSAKTVTSQQLISLNVYANPAGFKRAEAEAHRVGTLLAIGKFDWSEFLKTDEPDSTPTKTWIERLEEQYFSERARTAKTEGTWRKEYYAILAKLPQERSPTAELLVDLICTTKPDTRTRQRACYAASALAGVAGIELDISRLIGNYSPRHPSPRDLPSDQQIVEWRERIPNSSWQSYGVMATYGLRNHEIGS